MADFTPNNALLQKDHHGIFDNAQRLALLEDFMYSSRLAQVGSYKEMGGKTELKFAFQTSGPGAYWVGEAERIKTTKAEWANATMTSHKIATIIPISNEFRNYTMSDVFEELKPQIVAAINKQVDEAVFLGVDSPFTQNVLKSATDSGNIVTGDITGENIDSLIYGMAEKGISVSHFISNIKNLRLLNKAYEDVAGAGANAVANKLYDKSNNTLDGIPVVELGHESAMAKGTLLAGDFQYLFYGISRGFEYSISEDAQLSTIVYQDGDPMNLFEQDMIALRVTFQIGMLIAKDDAFGAIQAEVV